MTNTKDGTLSASGNISDKSLKSLCETLKERGYDGDYSEFSNDLVIEVPKKNFSDEAIENLRKIIASKDALIKKVLVADNLDFEVTDSNLRFPWFTLSGETGEADTYAQFIHAMCEMAKNQKRVIAQEKAVENEKFTMRLFLVRLGFVGDDYKNARRILIKNLTGNGSWKNGAPPQKQAIIPQHNESVTIPDEKEVHKNTFFDKIKGVMSGIFKASVTQDE